MYKKWTLFFYMFSLCVFAQNTDDKSIVPKIEIKVVENLLMIEPTLENLDGIDKSFYYKLTVFKTNKSNQNKSNNTQDGRIILRGNQRIGLSKAQINFGVSDEIIMLLLIYDEKNNLVGKDRKVFFKKIVDTEAEEAPDGILPIAIVANDTKSKFGGDFYEYFYKAYNDLRIRTPKIVNILEELSFGRNSRIIVSVDETVITEFITQPDDEFLKEMATYVADEVLTHFKNLEKQQKYITQY